MFEINVVDINEACILFYEPIFLGYAIFRKIYKFD
jgi:hypothetical protein